jgi:hypothetical protein
MNLGNTLFMRMLSTANLSKSSFVKATKAVRNTPDVGKTGSGSNVAMVEILELESDVKALRWHLLLPLPIDGNTLRSKLD